MPFFDEGADPRDQQGVNPPGRMPYGVNPPDPFAGPTTDQIVGAAFRQNNPVVSVLDAITRSRPDDTPVPGYSPVARLSGTKDDDLIEQSLADVNPAQTDARIARKNADAKDNQTLDASGWFGTVAKVGAGLLDPSWYVPIAGEMAAAGRGLSVAARAARGMGEGAIKATISETALQASQPNRTLTESASNIATNTILMGLIGGGMAMLSPGERAAARDGLEATRKDLSPGAPAVEDTGGPQLVVARRMPDGTIRYGNPGEVHTDLMTRKELNGDGATPQDNAMGFAKPGGAFMTREEALEFAARNEPSRAAHSLEQPENGLEAATYNEAIQPQLPFHDAAAIVPHEPLEPATLSSDLSAASSDSRTMKLSRILLPENMMHALGEVPVLGSAIDWSSKVLMNFSPNLRVFSSTSLVAKRFMGDAVDTALRFTQADQGITTARGGVTIERAVKMQKLAGETITNRVMAEQFIAHRGLEDSKFPMATATLQDMRGQAPGKMTWEDFNREVYLAGTNGDVHADPQVTAAIKQIRARVLDPVTKFAQSTMGPDGKPMLAEVLEPPKGDKSHMPRIWNQPVMAAKYNDAKGRFADWLEGQQGIKAAAKDRITAFNNALQSHELNIAKIEAKLSGRTDALEGLQDRQEELTRLNKAAYQRAELLRESQYRNDGGIRVAVPGKGLKNAQGGAVFETKIRQRGNVLADQASGKSAEIDTLEQQLLHETDNANGMRAKIEKEIADWEGVSTVEAKAALKTREKAEKLRAAKMAEGSYEGKGERLTGADNAVDSAVKDILKSDRDMPRSELEDRSKEIVNRINAGPNGRLNYDLASGGPAMGPPGERQQVHAALNTRDFAIPTAQVSDLIHTDIAHVISSHLRTVLPDIHLTSRFGDVEATQIFKNLNDEYDRKIAEATTEKQQVKLDRERKAMERDMAATRDRLRNVYGTSLTPTQRNMARVANAARNYNVIADLGTSVINRLFDSVNAVARHGLMNVFGDGYLPFFKSMVGMDAGAFKGAAMQSMNDASVGVNAVAGHMAHQFGDVMDNNLPGSKFERAISWGAKSAMKVNLHEQWTDAVSTIAGTVAGASFLRAAERITNGTHTADDISRMAQSGIDPTMATRIWKAYKDGGGEEFGKGTHVANTSDWKDATASDVYRAAVGRDADMSVLTPGLGEKSLWMSDQVLSLLGQYKSFIAAAHEKVLIAGLQQMDVRTLQGLVAAVGMGMLSYRLYTLVSGQQVSDRPQDWIKEGVTRSPVFGWITEINQMQSKFTGGTTDMFRAIGADHPLSRRQSNSALSELLGPTYSKLEGIAGGVNDAFHGTWTAMDSHKFRQAMPLQNLFAIRKLLDSAEDGFNERLGVKSLNRDPSAWPGGAPH